MIEYILYKIDHFLHKDRYLDTYIQNIISEKTGFKANKIKLLTACKSNMKVKNEFDTFTFKYEGLVYELYKDKLEISKDQEQ